MFALVDCNNFYASCERVFRPELNGKPVVVLSNNDGCVIARSNEAKELNIPMAAPAFKFKKIFKENNINVFSSNYALYGDMSNRVMHLLSEYSPDMEIYSIDEAFLKFDGFEQYNLQEYAEKIQRAVTKGTGIPVSIGLAQTKALSKVANRIAKKFPERTKSVYIIDNEEKRTKALKWIKVQDVWGIGRKHTKRLNNRGVYTAYQFTQLPDAWIKKEMSVVGLRLKHELEGKSRLDIETIQPKQNIATTRSFDKMYSDYETIKERVVTFAVTCAEKLRKQNSVSSSIMVFLHTNGFKKELPQYAKNIVVKFPFATNSSFDIVKFAVEGLDRIFKKGYKYKKAGVIVMDIIPDNPQQLMLFGGVNPKHKKIMQTMDSINANIGPYKLKIASQDQNKNWKMNQNKLSPRYTTKLTDIIKVK